MPHGPSTAAGSSLKSRSFPRQDDDCYLNKEQTPTTSLHDLPVHSWTGPTQASVCFDWPASI